MAGASQKIEGHVGIGTTAPGTTLETVGVAHVHDASVGPDNGYNGALRVTRAAATGQYLNLTRMGNYVWSLGTVYNTSKIDKTKLRNVVRWALTTSFKIT